MVPDENWKETRLTAEDLSLLLGVPVSTIENFLSVLENLIIHRFVEKLGDEDCCNNDYSVELPYLGSLVVSVNDSSKVSLSFVARNSFYRKIRRACNMRESPLPNMIGQVLGESLVKKLEEGDIFNERRTH